ncbi:MAG: HAMP domain-containing sensor histidine kinase [Immundisolibacter sp.]
MAVKRASLRQRLIIAFVVMTAAVSALFSLIAFVAIEELEETLFVHQLEGDLRWWMTHLAGTPQPAPLQLANQSRLYVVPDVPAALRPAFLAQQPRGWREVFDGGETYHVLRYDQADRRFYLVRRASALERRERAWLMVLAGGSGLSVLAALLLARLMAASILEPVLRLARRVRQADPQRLPRRLAAGFAADEIGELAQAFAQRLRELNGFIANERLFTSDVSHELRTPTAVIAGAAETLLARTELLPRARRAVERIHAAAGEMQDLIDAFLALGRNADISTAPPCSVNAVVRAEVERVRQSLPVADAAPRVEEHAPLTVRCPRCLLTVAVRNLLDNALNYATGQQVHLTVTGNAVLVDNAGSTLAPADIERAFARHQRLAPDVAAGEGLGLSIVQRICERLGWQVLAQALPDGMRFILRFEAEPAPRHPVTNAGDRPRDGAAQEALTRHF